MYLHHRPAPRRLAALCAVCIGTIAGLAACGSTSSSSTSASASTQLAAGSASTTSGTGKPVHVAMELIVTGLPFEAETQAGAEAAAKQFGATLNVSAPTTFDPATAISQVNSAISQGANGVAIADEPASLWTRALTNASSQTHGNTVTFNAVPAAGTVKTYVGNNDLALGQVLAAATIKAAHLGPGTTGQVIISNCNPTSSPLAVTVKGLVQTVQKLLPKATVDPPFNSQITPSANFTAWRQEISAHPSAVLALGSCDQDGDSMIKAKQAAGGQFAIGATDLDPLVLQGIANGTVAAAQAQDWYVEGYTAIRLLIDSVRNGTPPPDGWIQPGTTTVTKANVAQLQARDASAAGMAAFYKPIIAKLWGDTSAATQPLSAALAIG
jgi:ABC-type sugar transport system substrate-binding protein